MVPVGIEKILGSFADWIILIYKDWLHNWFNNVLSTAVYSLQCSESWLIFVNLDLDYYFCRQLKDFLRSLGGFESQVEMSFCSFEDHTITVHVIFKKIFY